MEQIHQPQHVALRVEAIEVADHRRLHALVAVAHVQLQPVANVLGRHALTQQVFAATSFQLFNVAIEARVIGEEDRAAGIKQHGPGADLVDVHLVHVAGADGGEHRGERRRQHLVDAQCGSDAAGVQRTVAAIGEDGEVVRLVAAGAQLGGDAVGHIRIHRALDELADFDQFEIEVIAELVLNRLFGAAQIEGDGAGGVIGRVEIAQQQIGVGHRRLHAAAVVAGRAGIGTGALGANLHRAIHAVELGDGAAAGAEGDQVHHRNRHQPAVDHRIEVVVLDAALHHDADVKAGAAHVGGDDVAKAGLLRQMFARRDA